MHEIHNGARPPSNTTTEWNSPVMTDYIPWASPLAENQKRWVQCNHYRAATCSKRNPRERAPFLPTGSSSHYRRGRQGIRSWVECTDHWGGRWLELRSTTKVRPYPAPKLPLGPWRAHHKQPGWQTGPALHHLQPRDSVTLGCWCPRPYREVPPEASGPLSRLPRVTLITK